MRLVWMIILMVIPWGALAQDTPLAVIERDLALLRLDVVAMKDQMATKAQYEILHGMISEIKTIVNPKLEKVESLDTWKDGHIKSHELLETGKDRSLVLLIGLITFIFAAITIGTNVVFSRRNGNHAG